MARARDIIFENFTGGLDLRSSAATIEPGYTPDAKNFFIDEYGGIEKIRGYSAFSTLGEAAHTLFTYALRNGTSYLIAGGASKVMRVDSAGTATNLQTGLTTNTYLSHAVVDDVVYWSDGVNGLASYDGSTVDTASFTSAPDGRILGVLDGQMYIALTSDPLRVEWSAPYDFTSWDSANDYVKLASSSSGDSIVDGIVTGYGLNIFTNSMTYLIHDSATGAGRMIDDRVGVSAHGTLSSNGDVVYGMDKRGAFMTDGRNPCAFVNDRVRPLFTTGSPVLSAATGVVFDNKYVASFTRSGSTNNLSLEFYSRLGNACMVNEYPMRAATEASFGNTDELYFVDASALTKVRKGYDGGDFAGTDITAYYVTPAHNLRTEEIQKRLQKVRVVGYGNLSVGVYEDYATSEATNAALGFGTLSALTWDTDDWDVGEWGGYFLGEGSANTVQGARGRYLSLKFSETGSTTSTGRAILGESLTEAGGAAIARIHLAFMATGVERDGKN